MNALELMSSQREAHRPQKTESTSTVIADSQSPSNTKRMGIGYHKRGKTATQLMEQSRQEQASFCQPEEEWMLDSLNTQTMITE